MAAKDIAALLKLHRAQLFGLLEIRGVRRLQPIYNQAAAEIRAKLAALSRQGKGDTFTAHHMRIVLAQVDDGIRAFAGKFHEHLDRQGLMAQSLGSRHTIAEIVGLERHFKGVTPTIDARQAAVVARVHRHIEPTLLDRYKRSTTFYTAPVVRKVREQLAVSIVSNATVDEAVDRVAGTSGVFETERWRAERIVRTELAHSYGAAKQETMREERQEMPDLQKRLVATFDDRTGEDSKKLHGQTQPVDKPFIWIKEDGKRVEYMHPPNRPQDRECVIPWRPGWSPSVLPAEPGPVTPRSPS